jgi:hypothetical protein
MHRSIDFGYQELPDKVQGSASGSVAIPRHLRLGITRKAFEWFYISELGFYHRVHKKKASGEELYWAHAVDETLSPEILYEVPLGTTRVPAPERWQTMKMRDARNEGADNEAISAGHFLMIGRLFGCIIQAFLSVLTCNYFKTFPNLDIEVELLDPLVPVTSLEKRSVDELRSLWGPYREGDQWITAEYPDRLTCYDIIACTKIWLQKQGNEEKSVCEVLQQRHSYYCAQNETERGKRKVAVRGMEYSLAAEVGGMVYYYPEDTPVGLATCFVSHIQKEKAADTLKALGSPDKKYWLDVTSLRQLQNDFDPEVVIALIQEIGHTVMSLDKDHDYLTRSFCILEAYGTHAGGGRLDVEPRGKQAVRNGLFSICCAREVRISVDSASATTRNPEDAQKVSNYITKNIGFDRLNEAIEQAAADGIRRRGARLFLVVMLFVLAHALFISLVFGVTHALDNSVGSQILSILVVLLAAAGFVASLSSLANLASSSSFRYAMMNFIQGGCAEEGLVGCNRRRGGCWPACCGILPGEGWSKAVV